MWLINVINVINKIEFEWKRGGGGESNLRLPSSCTMKQAQAQAPKRRHKKVDATWLLPHSHVCLLWTSNLNFKILFLFAQNPLFSS